MFHRDLKQFDKDGALYRGKPISRWARLLYSGNEAKRRIAAESLVALGEDALPAMFHLARRGDLPGYEVGEILARFGPSVVPKLLELLSDPEQGDDSQLTYTFHVLSRGEHSELALARLEEQSADSSSEVKRAAAGVMWFWSFETDEAPTALLKFLGDADPSVQSAAIRALGHGVPLTKRVTELMRPFIDHPLRSIRFATANALGPAGGEAIEPISREMVEILGGNNQQEAAICKKDIIRLGGPCVPALLDTLKNSDFYKRGRAATCLGEIRSEYASLQQNRQWREAHHLTMVEREEVYRKGLKARLPSIFKGLIEACHDPDGVAFKGVHFALTYGSLDCIPAEVLGEYLEAVRKLRHESFVQVLAGMLLGGDKDLRKIADSFRKGLNLGTKQLLLLRLLLVNYEESESDSANRIAALEWIGCDRELALIAIREAQVPDTDRFILADALFRKIERIDPTQEVDTVLRLRMESIFPAIGGIPFWPHPFGRALVLSFASLLVSIMSLFVATGSGVLLAIFSLNAIAVVPPESPSTNTFFIAAILGPLLALLGFGFSTGSIARTFRTSRRLWRLKKRRDELFSLVKAPKA